MTADLQDVAAAAQTVIDREEADSRYAHTTHLHVRVAARWSSTGTCQARSRPTSSPSQRAVLATVLGLAAIQGRLPWLDRPVADVLPVLAGTPSSNGTSSELPDTCRHVAAPCDPSVGLAAGLTSTNRHQTAARGTSTTGLIIRRSWVRAPPAPLHTRRSQPCRRPRPRDLVSLQPPDTLEVLAPRQRLLPDQAPSAGRNGTGRHGAAPTGTSPDGLCVRCRADDLCPGRPAPEGAD